MRNRTETWPATPASSKQTAKSKLVIGDLSGDHVHHQVDDAVGVAPLVVVPRHDLEEALLARQVVLQGGLGVIDGGVRVVDEIRRSKLLICVGQDSLHVRFCGCLQLLIDFLDGSVLLSKEGQVNHRHIWSWNTEGHASKLAFGDWKHFSHSLRCTCG